MPVNPSKSRLARVSIAITLSLIGSAIAFAMSEEKTLAGDPSKFELEYGCPADFPFPIEVNTKEDDVDQNGDGIVCSDGLKGRVDNVILEEDDVRLKVTGHGNFFDAGDSKGDEIQDISFSFHAIERGDSGAAKGQFEYHDQTPGGPDLRVHGEVLCLSIQPKVNRATIIGVVTQSNDLGLPVGRFVGWQAVDHGEGDNALVPDQVTRLFTVAGKGTVSCKEVFKPLPLRDTLSGNIQVFF